MKLQRIEQDFNVATGYRSFESAHFIVTKLKHYNGVTTQLQYKPLDYEDEIFFAGDTTGVLINDNTCLEQLSVTEIFTMIENVRKAAFEDGRRDKVSEMRNVLGL